MAALFQSYVTHRSHYQHKEETQVNEVTAYNLKTKKHTTMLNPELVTLKNGRKALRGVASDDGKTTVVKMLSADAIAEWEKA
jgi:hypothetical protein